MYRAFTDGVKDASVGNEWNRNLVAYTIFEATHLKQSKNFYFGSCFAMEESSQTKMTGNIAAGCERGCFRTEGMTRNPIFILLFIGVCAETTHSVVQLDPGWVKTQGQAKKVPSAF